MYISVKGVKWDKAPELGKNIKITVSEDIDIENEEEVEEYISEELSNQYGFCHYGWEEYEIIK